MFLSNFSIRQPVTTVAIIVVLMCLGGLAIKNLRVNSIPDVQEPVLVVVVPYPGASPLAVESDISKKIEEAEAKVDAERKKALAEVPSIAEALARDIADKFAPANASAPRQRVAGEA